MLDEWMRCIPGADESAAAAGCWPCIRFGEPTLTQGSLCEAPAAKNLCHCKVVHLVFPYIPSSTPFCLLRTSVQLGSDQPWVSSLNWVRNKEGHAGSQTPTINNLLPQSSQATASYHCVPSSRLQSCPFEKIWPNNVRLPQDNVRFNLLLFNMPRSKVR